MAFVLNRIVEFDLRFSFLCIIYKYRGGLIHSSGGESIWVILSVFLERGYMKVRLVSIYAVGLC